VEEEKTIEEIQKLRMEKDSLFQKAAWSPIPEAERDHFKGLHYYPIDLSWRFEGPITQYDSIINDTIVGTKGDKRPARKFGYFGFRVKNQLCRLEIYEIIRADTAQPNYLFLGFTDETTGKSTYGTGRYIDLETRNDSNYVVDFNTAYNPYCAYNKKYTCAIPPEENALQLSVTAGEKIYHEH
jgi:uncharacterized protein (DUF1684 family)